MPFWDRKKAAPAAQAPAVVASTVFDVMFIASITDGSIGGTVKVTMSPPHMFVPPALHVAIQEAAGKMLATATIETVENAAARVDMMDFYKSASSKFKVAEGKDAPGFQIVRIVIERKQLGSGDDD